jgi:Fur family peroxide stress response transcriptional regulator
VLKPSIPDLSLGTVYRNINLFREEGAVVSVGVVEGEERFDGRVSPHPHVVCCRCGRVADLPCPGGEEGQGGPAEDSREEAGGFVIDYRKTVYYGLCPDCAGEKDPWRNRERVLCREFRERRWMRRNPPGLS